MVKNLEDMQKFGKENVDATLKSFGVLSQSAKFGELYAGLAQETCKPFESYVKTASAK